MMIYSAMPWFLKYIAMDWWNLTVLETTVIRSMIGVRWMIFHLIGLVLRFNSAFSLMESHNSPMSWFIITFFIIINRTSLYNTSSNKAQWYKHRDKNNDKSRYLHLIFGKSLWKLMLAGHSNAISGPQNSYWPKVTLLLTVLWLWANVVNFHKCC